MKIRIPATLLLLVTLVIYGREPKDKPAVEFKKVSLDETMAQLRLYPNDSYLQYVAMILARNENRSDEIAGEIERMMGRDSRWEEAMDRRHQVDLFSIFTGALAVQESLQLDTMRGDRRSRGMPAAIMKGKPAPSKDTSKDMPPPKLADTPTPGQTEAMKKRIVTQYKPLTPEQRKEELRRIPESFRENIVKILKEEGIGIPEDPRPDQIISVASLTGPTIKSHPWEQMLSGKKPSISSLARCVPEDFYLVEFRSIAKMLEAMETSDLWGTHLFNQAAQEARTQKIGERLKEQLAIETTPLLRPFYDLVVSEMAVTGSDLFLREGSDVTLLFRFKQPQVFKARMDSFLSSAQKAHASAKKTTDSYLGVEYVHLGTPDRELDVYAAYPTADLHVRSNSLVGLRRVLEAIQGKTAKGQEVRRLGDTDEFAYIRTIFPHGAKEEDGLVYLSDPFIRKLVGPQLKLTERRRMLCYNYLRMISHAALLYRTEHGKMPESMDQLAKAGCCPGSFNDGNLRCPDGGKYALSEDGTTGICGHHGHAHFLTPCCEIPLMQVTGLEASEYQDFLREYNQYWRTFFDPIALRIQITPERYRLETIVLPLIDNSIYTSLAMALGGKPENLESLPIPKKNIFTVAFRFDKEKLLRESGLSELIAADQKSPKGEERPPTDAPVRTCMNNLKLIGLAMHNYHDTYGKFPAAAILDKQKKPLLSWRVQLLPFIEQQDLYSQFHLDEPWDSEHNKKLITRIPKEFQSPNRELTRAGKTTYLGPVGKSTMFPEDYKKITFASVTDGTSNTLLLVDADDDHAVIWTKPDDLKYDPDNPFTGLKGHHKNHILAVFADGAVRLLRDTIPKQTLQALFTRDGMDLEMIRWGDWDDSPSPVGSPPLRSRSMIFPPLEEIGADNLYRFLSKGIGNQAALHVYDAVPMFDFNFPSAIGMAVGSFTPRMGGFGSSEMAISFLIASLNAPVYISIPVQDEKIVDEFLDQVDAFAAVLARQQERGFISLDFDFYKFPLKKDQATICRSYALRFGPVKLRFHWARIGKGLYIASKPFILEDLRESEESRGKEQAAEAASNADVTGHGMVRVRAKNWNQVLADYRLAWAENSRVACLHNLGPLTSVSRAIVGDPARIEADKRKELSRQICLQADRLHTTHFFCPDGGEYVLADDGKSMTCTIHGTAAAPRQFQESQGTLADLLTRFSGMTANLTFRDEGLHAVVTIERK
jgi:hypothetical protein